MITDLLDLTVREIAAGIAALPVEELEKLREAELAGKTRKMVLAAIDEELAARERGETPPEAPALPAAEAVPLAVAELQILGADYTGDLCEIRVGSRRFSGRGESREAAYRSAVGAWLASEGKALA